MCLTLDFSQKLVLNYSAVRSNEMMHALCISGGDIQHATAATIALNVTPHQNNNIFHES